MNEMLNHYLQKRKKYVIEVYDVDTEKIEEESGMFFVKFNFAYQSLVVFSEYDEKKMSIYSSLEYCRKLCKKILKSKFYVKCIIYDITDKKKIVRIFSKDIIEHSI